ncbi:recombinase family protein [Porticoccus sp. W117]|uniref:recombinase family protein n=1 Tax=Porticoccus sp. W117 TaxID=3054777 RepID=UPI0025926BED|nr:recombinase family protein [Porticoccus sp. W117]MDM3870224.1 recombinase family protein [Porticoccus sp. W117]
MRYGYVRTSTTDRQINELEGCCDKVYIEDGVSARKKNRPVFQEVYAKLKAGDAFVVISYDRAFRSTVEGLNSLDDLTERGVKLESLSQRFDPTTPDGRFFYTMIIAAGEWEIGILSRRTIDGLQAAIKRGAKLGRPKKQRKPKLPKEQEAKSHEPQAKTAALL